MKKTVVIGFLGTTIDNGFNYKRWEKWRPSISISQQNDLLIDKFHIIYSKKYEKLFNVIKEDIEMISPETEIIPEIIEFNDPWDFEEVFSKLHNYAKNFKFDIENNNYLIHITTGTHVAQICLFLLTETHYFPAKILQTSPSRKNRFDSKGEYTVIDLDLSKYDNIASRFNEELNDDLSFLKSGIDTKNIKFNELISCIEKVAIRSIDPILLIGPTGAGKSHLATNIFKLKKLKRQIKGEFIEINCATLKGGMAMSALFGHKKGAFTGAASDRLGALKNADNGILFLDEIGELGLDEQAMLLKAIEEKKFTPVGSDKQTFTNFQLISGTNRDLLKEVKKGNFREDLFSRINLWTFNLPGLSERVEDIEPNIDYELSKYGAKMGRSINFNKEAKEYFLNFAKSKEGIWRGNFRDLNSAIIRMCTLASGGRVSVDDVKEEIKRLKTIWGIDNSKEDIILPSIEIKDIDLFDKYQLSAVLKICKNSKTISDAGRKLFNYSRKNRKSINDSDRLKKYLAKFGIDWENIDNLF